MTPEFNRTPFGKNHGRFSTRPKDNNSSSPVTGANNTTSKSAIIDLQKATTCVLKKFPRRWPTLIPLLQDVGDLRWRRLRGLWKFGSKRRRRKGRLDKPSTALADMIEDGGNANLMTMFAPLISSRKLTTQDYLPPKKSHNNDDERREKYVISAVLCVNVQSTFI